jgi:hypothetical protein
VHQREFNVRMLPSQPRRHFRLRRQDLQVEREPVVCQQADIAAPLLVGQVVGRQVHRRHQALMDHLADAAQVARFCMFGQQRGYGLW